ncbi:MAG: hypothetical protein SFY80_10425 [Verrucomicrobiota bacterium]|nr:hypothetical protein [Verrucomicrobiota bacterium]
MSVLSACPINLTWHKPAGGTPASITQSGQAGRAPLYGQAGALLYTAKLVALLYTAKLVALLYTAKLASLQERGRLARVYHTKRPSWPRSFIRPSWHLYRSVGGPPAYITQSGQAGRAPLYSQAGIFTGARAARPLLSHTAAQLETLLYSRSLALLHERGRPARIYHTKRPSWPRSFGSFLHMPL